MTSEDKCAKCKHWYESNEPEKRKIKFYRYYYGNNFIIDSTTWTQRAYDGPDQLYKTETKEVEI